MPNYFFTSDYHFGHKNVLRHDSRPFPDIDTHDEALIENHNKVVKNGDQVYLIGDLAYRNTKTIEGYVKRLNGTLHFIRGNHDDKGAWKYRNLFASANEALYLRLNDERMYMSHYSMRVWRNSHHGSWHLFGHSHGQMGTCPCCHAGEGKVLDVWVGGHNYTPWHFDEIREYMKARPTTVHHEPPEGSELE
jgi:calcineurin-like phosphoesterase family protein